MAAVPAPIPRTAAPAAPVALSPAALAALLRHRAAERFAFLDARALAARRNDDGSVALAYDAGCGVRALADGATLGEAVDRAITSLSEGR